MTATSLAQAVISVTDLRKAYGSVKALDGVSFEVGSGEVFSLLGPNGAGKTTTVEILEGLTTPDSGMATVLGIDPVRDPAPLKERIGVQLQTAALYPNLSVKEQAMRELLDSVPGVRDHARVVAVEENVFVRPGPRVVQAARQLNAILGR